MAYSESSLKMHSLVFTSCLHFSINYGLVKVSTDVQTVSLMRLCELFSIAKTEYTTITHIIRQFFVSKQLKRKSYVSDPRLDPRRLADSSYFPI